MSLFIFLNVIFILLAGCSLFATLLELPGNLLIFMLAILYGFIDGFSNFTVGDVVLVFAVYLVGELAEIGMGALWAKREQASRRAIVWAFLGAVLGGLAGTLLLPLAGSIAGVLMGCFSGAYFAEASITGDRWQAMRVAKCVLQGQICGIIIKCTAGISMISYLIFHMSWQ